jgi:hypothetical protein
MNLWIQIRSTSGASRRRTTIINQGTQRAFGTQPGAPDGNAPAATEARIEQRYFDGCIEEGLP